jgi:molecular chaperone Hsp33
MHSKDGFILASAIDSTDIAETARAIHSTSPTATAALGRALSIASLFGKTLKAKGGSVTLQFKGGGPGGTMVVVSDTDGNVRGYIQNPLVDIERKPNGKLDVGGLIGSDGCLTVIKDLQMEQPYIGTVGMLSGEIADDVASYFAESEQIPTACAAGVLVNPDGTVKCAGAYLLQLMPGCGPAAAANLESSVLSAGTVTQMLRDGLSPEEMIRRAAGGAELVFMEEIAPEYRCYCSRDRVSSALISTGRAELTSMAEEQEGAEVTCQFCDKVYHFTKKELPLYKDFDNDKRGGIVIMMCSFAYVGASAIIHNLAIKYTFGTTIYGAVILLLLLVYWNISFKVTWEEVFKGN